MPGHSSSWCAGEPTICPSACPTPLSPAAAGTTAVLHDVGHDLLSMFGGPLHFGGDEVWTQCWDASPEIVAHLAAHNMTDRDA
eukprot:SAG22_NODE_373_length_11549_cov_12.592052_2_plen_83_part_00